MYPPHTDYIKVIITERDEGQKSSNNPVVLHIILFTLVCFEVEMTVNFIYYSLSYKLVLPCQSIPKNFTKKPVPCILSGFMAQPLPCKWVKKKYGSNLVEHSKSIISDHNCKHFYQ